MLNNDNDCFLSKNQYYYYYNQNFRLRNYGKYISKHKQAESFNKFTNVLDKISYPKHLTYRIATAASFSLLSKQQDNLFMFNRFFTQLNNESDDFNSLFQETSSTNYICKNKYINYIF